MERRHFLKLAIGVAAGAAAIAGTAAAAPLAPQSLGTGGLPSANDNARPAVTTEAEVEGLKPEEVHWGHHWRRHWHRRWHRWHHRHWGWRRHHWHRHHWHRRYW